MFVTILYAFIIQISDTSHLYRDLLIVLPMREPSIFRGIAVSLLRPVIGSNVEIDVVALNWVADICNQIATAFVQMIVQLFHFKLNCKFY